jgi:hypothetical protein
MLQSKAIGSPKGVVRLTKHRVQGFKELRPSNVARKSRRMRIATPAIIIINCSHLATRTQDSIIAVQTAILQSAMTSGRRCPAYQ